MFLKKIAIKNKKKYINLNKNQTAGHTSNNTLIRHTSDTHLLAHNDIPKIIEKDYTLIIDGLVEKKLVLTLDDIKQRPAKTIDVVMECSENARSLMMSTFNKHKPTIIDGASQAKWTGCSLKDLLDEVKIKSTSFDPEFGMAMDIDIDIIFTGHDRYVSEEKENDIQSNEHIKSKLSQMNHYQRSLNINKDLIINDCILAYMKDGLPLTPEHGYPLRLIVPGWYGMSSVKWLKSINIVKARYKDEKNVSATSIKVRAILKPPGIRSLSSIGHMDDKDNGTTIPIQGKINSQQIITRYLEPGDNLLEGKAWVGGSTSKNDISIVEVKISLDNGLNWNLCNIIENRKSPWGWYTWHYLWKNATLGKYVLVVSATDSDANKQPSNIPNNALDYKSIPINIASKLFVNVINLEMKKS